MIAVFLAAFTIMLASLAGVLFISGYAEKWMQRNSRYLVTFAAGVFIIVSYGLFMETFEFSVSLVKVIVSVAAGALALELVNRMLPNRHHHHGTDHQHSHSPTDARRLLIGDTFHNIIDGIMLVPAFLIDIRVGIAAALAVFLHEVVQEISEFFVLKEAGYSTPKALSMNFLASSSIFLGVLLGDTFAKREDLLSILLPFAAGSFLYVIFRDLLPSAVRDIIRRQAAAKHLVAGILGITIMLGVGVIVPEENNEPYENRSKEKATY